MSELSPNMIRRSVGTAAAGAALVMLVGASVFIGWLTGNPVLISVLPGHVPIKPITATSYVLLGLAVVLCARGNTSSAARPWAFAGARLASLLAAAIGGATLAEHALHRDFGFDMWLFGDRVRATFVTNPGRMAYLVSAVVGLLGGAQLLVLSRSARVRAVGRALAVLCLGVGLLGIARYLYGVEASAGLTPYVSASLPSTVVAVVIGAAVLALHPSEGLVTEILSSKAGGVMARRLLPAAVLLPMTFGYLRLQGELAGFYQTRFGLALFACSNVITFVALTWWTSRRINRFDEQREAADRATAALVQENARRARTLIESLPQLIWTCDAAGLCDYVSPQWLAYTGRTAEEQLEEKWIDQVHPDDVPHLRAQWASSMSDGGRLLDSEFRLRRADGVYRWFRTMAHPVKDDGGRIVKWFGTNTDIDDRKRAEAELQSLTAELEARVHERTRELEKARDRAESADRLKTDFIMNMSHELRTPLNAMIGFTGTLLMHLPGPLNADQEQQMKIVQSNARNLLLIINDILDVARIESGTLTLASESIDVGALLKDVAKELAPLAQDKQLVVVVEAPARPVMLTGDRRSLKQIVTNLTGNAIKFTREGQITLACRQTPRGGGVRQIELAVEDTGPGIAPEDRSRLFTKFGRLDDAGRADGGGMGLGLYLSRILAEQLGGRISIESEPGRGSRFVVTFEQLPIEK